MSPNKSQNKGSYFTTATMPFRLLDQNGDPITLSAQQKAAFNTELPRIRGQSKPGKQYVRFSILRHISCLKTRQTHASLPQYVTRAKNRSIWSGTNLICV